MVLPGPEAQQLATYIGWLMHRTWGGVVAGVLFVLPSFMFILLGGPLVESTHGQLKFTAPLKAITAAVVGVILNLALFFAYHVLWPQGFAGHFDVVSAAIALVAALVLFRFKQSVMRVIAASALLGLLLQVSGVQGS
jgi:chromate transporter